MNAENYSVLLDFAADFASTSGDSPSCTCISCEAVRVLDQPHRIVVMKFDDGWSAVVADGRGELSYLINRFPHDTWRGAMGAARRHLRAARRAS